MNFMILDGNSLVNRAFYGVRELNAPDGTPTNAVYGFLAILQHLLEEADADFQVFQADAFIYAVDACQLLR